MGGLALRLSGCLAHLKKALVEAWELWGTGLVQVIKTAAEGSSGGFSRAPSGYQSDCHSVPIPEMLLGRIWEAGTE